jgi:hypothetical protein
MRIRLLGLLLVAEAAFAGGSEGPMIAEPAVGPANQLVIPSLTLTLRDSEGACALVVASPATKPRTLRTLVPWPCAFHNDLAGKARTKQRGKDTYAIIESSRRTSPNDCETFLQAVRVRGTSVQVSKHRSRLASCPPFQWESPLFFEMF